MNHALFPHPSVDPSIFLSAGYIGVNLYVNYLCLSFCLSVIIILGGSSSNLYIDRPSSMLLENLSSY